MQPTNSRLYVTPDNQYQLDIIAPLGILNQLDDISVAHAAISDGDMALAFRWYSPTYDTNFVNSWRATTLPSEMSNVEVVTPEPQSFAPLALGGLIVHGLWTRARKRRIRVQRTSPKC